MIAGLAVTCNAMRRRRLANVMGQVRSLPGDCALAPVSRSRTSFAIAQQMRHPAGGSTLTRGRSWWGWGPGVRYTSPLLP